MSSIKVQVTTLREVRPHPNADALELATVGGWQMCVKKGQYQSGDPVVYFEQGTALPRDMAERLNIDRYLAEKTDIHGEKRLVVHRIRLRGEPSFGLVIAAEPGMAVGDDMAEHYGAIKFFPPVRIGAGDADSDDPRFPAYTDMENLRSYPCVLTAGEEVVVTEKIHGTNCRVGFVVDGEDEDRTRTLMAGSRALRRKDPGDAEAWGRNTYWFPHTLESVTALLDELFEAGHSQVALYGEVFGPGIQSYQYGQNVISFRAFDLMVDRRYLDHDDFLSVCERHGVAIAPEIHRGAYDSDGVKELSEGASVVGGKDTREGVVVKPVRERTHSDVGRVILKYLSDKYLFGKGGQQDTTDQ